MPRRFGARDGRARRGAGAQTAPDSAAGWVGGSGRQRLCEVIYGWPHPTHAAQVVVVGLHASRGPWGSLGWAGAGWFSSQSAPWAKSMGFLPPELRGTLGRSWFGSRVPVSRRGISDVQNQLPQWTRNPRCSCRPGSCLQHRSWVTHPGYQTKEWELAATEPDIS